MTNATKVVENRLTIIHLHQQFILIQKRNKEFAFFQQRLFPTSTFQWRDQMHSHYIWFLDDPKNGLTQHRLPSQKNAPNKPQLMSTIPSWMYSVILVYCKEQDTYHSKWNKTVDHRNNVVLAVKRSEPVTSLPQEHRRLGQVWLSTWACRVDELDWQDQWQMKSVIALTQHTVILYRCWNQQPRHFMDLGDYITTLKITCVLSCNHPWKTILSPRLQHFSPHEELWSV